MKKSYTKPKLIFDSFEVSANIASCASDARQTQGDCAVIIGGMPVFVQGVNGCKFSASDGSYGVCYFVPTEDSSLFGS
ncbi:MAG: hypothetical protein IJT70_07270 [Clostridia bacterium]|nr:hypothetical protein [Clostridia bacterium]